MSSLCTGDNVREVNIPILNEKNIVITNDTNTVDILYSDPENSRNFLMENNVKTRGNTVHCRV